VAILKFDKKSDFVNRFTLHPSRSFTSASDGSVTGSIKLTQFPVRTRVDLDDSSTFQQGTRHSLRSDQYVQDGSTAFDEIGAVTKYVWNVWWLQTFVSESIFGGDGGTGGDGGDWAYSADAVMADVRNVPIFGPDKKTFEITRFTPYLETVTLDTTAGIPTSLSISSTGSYRKNTIRKHLFRDNTGTFRKCDWAYSNAHTINFFTASSVESSCAVIYPDPTGSTGTANYRPDSGFTFEFYINPRYTTDGDAEEFHAGTILHYSSAYALSLVSGSSRALDGRPDGFRLLLQLSSSADATPSSITIGSQPSGWDKRMVYSSSDNSLTKGKWHHCAVRWGGLNVQEGTGSFVIDGVVDSEFVIPSASITAPPGQTAYVGFAANTEDANALFFGNYYEAANTGSSDSTKDARVARFFNSKAVTDEGVMEVQGAAGALAGDPVAYGFTHKLNAELHELRIFKEYRDINQIGDFRSVGFGESQFATEKSGSLALYVPPFFIMEAPDNKIFFRPFKLSTPVRAQRTPYQITMSFNNEGFVLNHSNFFRDFVTKRYPRFFNLTGSTSLTVDGRHANDQLRDDPAMNARNFLILPNDNGSFSPDYTLLKTGTFTLQPTTASLLRRFVNDRSVTDLSVISLNRMLGGRYPKRRGGFAPEGSLYEPAYPEVNAAGEFTPAFWSVWRFDESIDEAGDWDAVLESKRVIDPAWVDNMLESNSPSTPAELSPRFYVFEATGDESSNQAVFFNVSNVFYGKGIKPGTVTVSDTNVMGSNNKISIVLKDDGFGSLYRANSPTPNKLHSVGNVFYNNGIIAIKSPHLFQFGSGSFSIDFQGTQDVFNREILVEAPKNLLNTSSNPTFQKLAPTDDANETADEFVYITTVLLHDEDMNVIGRATVADPIVKRTTDAITFRLKKDF